MNKEDILLKEEEIKIFKKVNGVGEHFKTEHTNFVRDNKVCAANTNQGVARAKLREFVAREDVDYEYWIK